MKETNDRVEIFHRINKLKLKAGGEIGEAGEGFIDPRDLRRAQKIITERGDKYAEGLEEMLVSLDSTWTDFKSAKTNDKVALNKIYNFANNIKDLAETYDYALMSYFATSLRESCKKIDPARKEHYVIIQAHIDVMWVVFRAKMKNDGGPIADELKKIVLVAVDKFF